MDPSRKFTHSLDAVHAVNPAQFYKINPNAQEPEAFSSDDEVGFFWDIYAVTRDENRSDDVTGDLNVFGTGFAVVPPAGFHFVIEPHPELYKFGYTMFHPHRIYQTADPEEPVNLVLFKYKDCDDLDLPHAVGRMFLQPNTTTAVNVNRAARAPISQPQKKRGAPVSTYDEYIPQQQSIPLPTNARRSRQGGLA